MSARVLVAHDAPMVVAILGHKLRREGHKVTTARGAGELRRVLANSSFECAVCEAALVDGRGTTPETLGCAWLAIVDGRDAGAALRAMHAGAAGVVRTPFKPTEVAAQVATLLLMLGVGA